MVVLVTGANGMFGLDLCPLLEEAGHQVIRTDRGAREGAVVPAWEPLDITDTAAVTAMIETRRPDAVIHAAAFTDVDGCERTPDTAYRINAFGTWNIAAACGNLDIPLVYISTDFVFDGEKQTPYTEFDAVHPLGEYGTSKLAGENIVRSLCRRQFVARTAWLFGVHGKSFPASMLHLAKTRTDINVVTDQVGSPTHTVDLARTIIRLLGTSLYGTYHVTNKGQCSWCQFAAKTLEMAGVEGVTVHPIPSSEWPTPTQRPAYSVLRHFALELQGLDDLKTWEEALADFLERRMLLKRGAL